MKIAAFLGTGPVLGGNQVRWSGHPLLDQVVRFAIVGGMGTATNAALFLLARPWLDTLAANLLALLLSTMLSTELNRRFTFGGAVPYHGRLHLQTVGTVLFYAVYSSAVLVLLGTVVDEPTPTLQILVVVVTGWLGGLCRFLVLQYWVFRREEAGGVPSDRTGRPSVPRTTVRRHAHVRDRARPARCR